jgi:hypothetical protein
MASGQKMLAGNWQRYIFKLLFWGKKKEKHPSEGIA